MADSLFPHIKKAVEDFLIDQEGNIPRGKVLSVGSMLLILSILMADEALAAHGSHKSHSSHTSHLSSYTAVYQSHASHKSHTSHRSHMSRATTLQPSVAPSPTPVPKHSSHGNAVPSRAALSDIKSPDAGIVLPKLPTTKLPPDTTPAR